MAGPAIMSIHLLVLASRSVALRPSLRLDLRHAICASAGLLDKAMGALTLENRSDPPLAMASDRSLSSASGSSRAPHESPCLATAGAGSSCTTQWLLPSRSARPRERFSDLLTMIGGTTNTFGVRLP